MAAKCALVVDDSRSARAFLSRMLEKHELNVDTAESAEEAIEYLTRHRPDVIFMDHLMPGMDGFQAVQAIKNNPRTATIPILMYTSQEGELYLGQARALGAIGVLPKQIRPADVTQVLAQLHLYDRREPAPAEPGPNDPTQVAKQISGISTISTPVLPPELQAAASAPPSPPLAAAVAETASNPALTGRYAFGSPVEQLLRDQIAEVRRTLVARLDELQDGLPSQMHAAVRAELPPPAPPVLLPEPDRRGWRAAAVAAALALLFAVLWARELGERQGIERSLAARASADAAATAVPAAGQPPAAVAAADEPPAAPVAVRPRLPASPLTFTVPYGDTPLAGERVGAIRSALEELRRADFTGDVEIQAFPGRFCMVGNATDGYALPPDDMAQSKCDRVGNPNQEAGASRESQSFANMLAEQRRAAGTAMNIRVVDGADRALQPYPDAASTPTAGAWNASALANNRVELRWRERP